MRNMPPAKHDRHQFFPWVTVFRSLPTQFLSPPGADQLLLTHHSVRDSFYFLGFPFLQTSLFQDSFQIWWDSFEIIKRGIFRNLDCSCEAEQFNWIILKWKLGEIRYISLEWKKDIKILNPYCLDSINRWNVTTTLRRICIIIFMIILFYNESSFKFTVGLCHSNSFHIQEMLRP